MLVAPEPLVHENALLKPSEQALEQSLVQQQRHDPSPASHQNAFPTVFDRLQQRYRFSSEISRETFLQYLCECQQSRWRHTCNFLIQTAPPNLH